MYMHLELLVGDAGKLFYDVFEVMAHVSTYLSSFDIYLLNHPSHWM